MKRILKMLRGNRHSRQRPQGLGTPMFERLEPRLLLNAVPYMQDFSLGKPGGADGWEYYSTNEGRIEVVGGHLRMDDKLGNATFSLNEAILHVNLTGKTGVTLTLDHWSLMDEPDTDTFPNSFVSHYKGDAIALSVDGQHWVKVTGLTNYFTNKSFALDTVLQQAKVAAGSSDLSDVRIKFQQYDNYPAPDDGREFDNIKITVISSEPEMDVLGNSQIISDGDTTPSSVDHTDFGSVAVGGSLTRTFTIRNTGAGALNLTGVPNKVQWTGSTDFTVVQQPSSPVAAYGGTTTFQIRFTPNSTGLKTATLWISNNDSNENPYNFVIQGIGSSFTVGNTQVFTDIVTTANRRAMPFTMSESGTIQSISIYHEGGTGNVLLSVYSDSGGLPGSRLGVTDSTAINGSAGWQTVDLLSPVGVSAGQTIWLAWVFENNPGIRWQPGSPGRADSVQTWSGGMPATFGSSTQADYVYSIFATYTPGEQLVAQVVPYMQDFSLGKPTRSQGWEYYSDNEGRIEVVGGRLRMDDTVGNSTFSLNEAILHVDLSGKTNVMLTLDHTSIYDESHPLPGSFVDRYKGDGIALSVDGQHWVKVTDLTVDFTNQSFALDTILQQAQIAAGSTDLSDVRIKFQQYDNYPALDDGREFDNIRVT